MNQAEGYSLVFEKLEKRLQRVNTWPKTGESFSMEFVMKCIIPIILLGIPIGFGLLGDIYKSIQNGFITYFTFDIYWLNLGALFQIVGAIFLYRGDEFVSIVSNFRNPKYGIPENFRKIQRMIDNLTESIYHYVLFLSLTFIPVRYFWDAKCYSMKISDPENAKGYICGMACPAWFPFDLNEFPFKYLLIICNGIAWIHYASNMCPSVLLLYGFVILTVNRVEQLKGFLKMIDITENIVVTERKLKFCIRYYTEISSLVEDINGTIGLMFAPTQNVLCALMIALLEYLLVSVRHPLALGALVMWLGLEAMACYSGQILEDTSASLSEQVYDLPWYEMDKSVIKDFQIFHAQVQNTLRVKLKPSIHMNMEYFYKVMKGSYSFLMYLKKF